MKKTQLTFNEPRSSKRNLMDRVLLASWITLYSMLLLGFGVLKRFEGIAKQNEMSGGHGGESN
jgi:hypothetical protein